MQHMITFHIHLGYTFCIVMVLSVILFFTFFGKVCTDFKNGDDKLDTCKKFTDEIMITGWVTDLPDVSVRVYRNRESLQPSNMPSGSSTAF